jgi:hypothetical protein
MVLAAYYRQPTAIAMPVDGWSIHGFVLNEVSCDKNPDPDHLGCSGAEIPPGIDDATGLVLDPANTPPHDWIERNDDFDIFAKTSCGSASGWRRTAIATSRCCMSEYGVLVPGLWYPPFSTAQRVNSFMNRTFDYLLTARDALGLPSDDYRLVQRLSWFSTTDQDLQRLSLLPDRTDHGDRSQLQGLRAQHWRGGGLHRRSLHATPPSLLAANGAVTMTLTGHDRQCRQPGAARSNAVVRFYNGDPRRRPADRRRNPLTERLRCDARRRRCSGRT